MAVFSPTGTGSVTQVGMGRFACLFVVLSACIDQAPITVDKPALDLPRGAGTDVRVAQAGQDFPLDELVWLVDDDAIATVTRTSDGDRLRISAVGEGVTSVHVGSHGQVVDIFTHVSPPAFVQLWIEPSVITAPIGEVVPMRATAIDTTNTIRDVSDLTGWQVMDTGVATLDAHAITGTHSGHTMLQAVLADTATTVPITVY
jgi:hypothetical protein